MIYTAIQNAITESTNEKINDFNPMEEALSFVYESECTNNALCEALNQRTIRSLQETGSIEPLNEQEKDGFFVKIVDALKKFWKIICDFFSRIWEWIKSLFKRKDAKKDEAAKKGAQLYLTDGNLSQKALPGPTRDDKRDEKMAAQKANDKGIKRSDGGVIQMGGPNSTKKGNGPTLNRREGWSYDGLFSFSRGIAAAHKVADYEYKNETDSQHRYSMVISTVNSLANNANLYEGTDTAINMEATRKKMIEFNQGKKLDNIFETYAPMFLKGTIDEHCSSIENQTKALENSKNEFGKYVDDMTKKLGAKIKDKETSTDSDKGDKVTIFKSISAHITAINNIFTTAYSVQSAGTKNLVKDIMDSKNYFASIGYKAGSVTESAEESEPDSTFMESTKESISNEFLAQLSII